MQEGFNNLTQDYATAVAKFEHLTSLLDPYREFSNTSRAGVIRKPARTLRPTPQPSGLSIIVLHKNRPDLLGQLFQSFIRLTQLAVVAKISVELLLGDTGSTEKETIDLLKNAPPGVRVIDGMSYHFSRCNNDLFELSSFDSILFMNNDVLIDQCPEALLKSHHLLNSDWETGIVGAVLEFIDGSLQHGGVDFFQSPDLFSFCYHPGAHERNNSVAGSILEASATTGAFLMVGSQNFAHFGGFDEAFNAECQDIDFCLRMKRSGYKIKIPNFGRLIHIENGTREIGEENWGDRALFVRRWSSFIEMQ